MFLLLLKFIKISKLVILINIAIVGNCNILLYGCDVNAMMWSAKYGPVPDRVKPSFLIFDIRAL